MTPQQVKALPLAKVYPAILGKVTRKGHTEPELQTLISWLLGYSVQQVSQWLAQPGATYGAFFEQAPALNPNRLLVTGRICGVKVEEIEDPVIRDMRCLDKMVDELVHGKAMEKILRAPKE